MSKRSAAAWQIVKTMPTTGGEVGVVDLHPGGVVTIGRSAELPEFGRVDHKYISRAHVAIRLVTDPVSQTPRVVIQQLGKNPTLIGPAASRLSPAGVDASAPSCVDITAEVAAATTQSYHHAHSVGLTTLHFPAELKFPMYHILFVAPAATAPAEVAAVAVPDIAPAEQTLSERDGTLVVAAIHHHGPPAAASSAEAVTRMMTMALRGGDSDDDEDVQPPPARQTKLLDEALRQQAIANATEANRAKESASWVAPPAGAIPEIASLRRPSVKRDPVVATSQPVAAQSAPSEAPRTRAAAPAAAARQLTEVSETSLTLVASPITTRPGVETKAAPPPAVLGSRSASPPSLVAAVPSAVPHLMGMWEWKCHVEGDDKDPKNWRKYPKAIADVLEAAFRSDGGKVASIAVDATYRVCFDDSRIGMAQYRADNPARWRAVRRRGGDTVARPKAKKRAILRDTGFTSSSSSNSSSDDDEDDDKRPSWIVSDDSADETDDDDSDDDDVSFDTESSIETESSDRRKKKNKQKKAPPKKGATAKKRPRED
jgi:hypothetical protein